MLYGPTTLEFTRGPGYELSGYVATRDRHFFFLKLAESNTAKFYSVVMAHTVISVKLPPNIDPTKARLAYGDRALPKLVSMIICISKYLRSKVRN